MNTAHSYVKNLVEFFCDRDPPKGWAYRGVDHFILTHGREWGPRTKVPKGAPSTDKECFTNAGYLAIDWSDPPMTYVEGYATAMIPMHHAWVVDADGRVIDPTWTDHPDADYFGVAFKADYIRREILRTETWGMLWEHECRPNIPLMTGKARGWKVAAS